MYSMYQSVYTSISVAHAQCAVLITVPSWPRLLNLKHADKYGIVSSMSPAVCSFMHALLTTDSSSGLPQLRLLVSAWQQQL